MGWSGQNNQLVKTCLTPPQGGGVKLITLSLPIEVDLGCDNIWGRWCNWSWLSMCRLSVPLHSARLSRDFQSAFQVSCVSIGGPQVVPIRKFLLVPMGVLTPCLRTFEGVANRPIHITEICLSTCLQSHLQTSPLTPLLALVVGVGGGWVG